jgi:hypothetical protein
VGFGGKFGGSRAARADGTVVWVWNSRSKQLARTERDFAAHTTALEMADAAKRVNRQEYCLTQPRATIIMSMPAGPCGRPTAEAAEPRLPGSSRNPEGKLSTPWKGTRGYTEWYRHANLPGSAASGSGSDAA